jgi:hypothetical protein
MVFPRLVTVHKPTRRSGAMQNLHCSYRIFALCRPEVDSSLCSTLVIMGITDDFYSRVGVPDFGAK